MSVQIMDEPSLERIKFIINLTLCKLFWKARAIYVHIIYHKPSYALHAALFFQRLFIKPRVKWLEFIDDDNRENGRGGN